jgi:uncharacterized membrane protein YfcA
MDIAGYLASVLIGISLGLLGGGGSILTVPVLVYLFKVEATAATVYSLFIVGATSIAGSIAYLRKGWINFNTLIIFGIPSLIAIFLTRQYIVPSIPGVVFTSGNMVITKDIFLLLLFALLMIVASYSMIRKSKYNGETYTQDQPANYPQMTIQGVLVGSLTAMVGAGGGFLIIPVLVNLQKLPVKTAIGTSLLIIATNSLAGFLFSLSHVPVQWKLVGGITFLAIIGILAGSYLSTKIDGKKLKPAFGWFTLVMGIYIILKETLLK